MSVRGGIENSLHYHSFSDVLLRERSPRLVFFFAKGHHARLVPNIKDRAGRALGDLAHVTVSCTSGAAYCDKTRFLNQAFKTDVFGFLHLFLSVSVCFENLVPLNDSCGFSLYSTGSVLLTVFLLLLALQAMHEIRQ